VQICQKDSQDITAEDRAALVEAIGKWDGQRVLITHGTDTMLDSAAYLLENGGDALADKTVVLTGSYKPECFKGSDAAFNLGVAIGALQLVPCGVYVSMNGLVHEASNVRRDLESGYFCSSEDD